MGNFINQEIIHSWKNQKRAIVILFLLSFIGVICIGMTIALNIGTSSQVETYKDMYEENQYYSILDNFVGEQEGELEEVGNTYKFKKFLSLLNNSEYFEYLMMYNQFIYIADYKGNEKNIYGYEHTADLSSQTIEIQGRDGAIRSCTCMKGFWIGDNVADAFKFELAEGSNFSAQDFVLTSRDNISIILGANYADDYKVGDTVYIDFVFSERQAKVIGILEEGTNVYYHGSYINLDTSVIMPIFLNDTYNGSSVFKFNVNHFYTLRNSGVIRTKLSCEDVQQLIEAYSKEAGFENGYYVTEYEETERATFSLSMENIKTLLDIVAFVIILLIMIALIIYHIDKLQKNSRYYAILLLNGSSKGSIFKIILREVAIVMAITYIIGAVAVILFTSLEIEDIGKTLVLLMGGSVIFSIIPTSVAAIVFFKRDLIRYMKEEI